MAINIEEYKKQWFSYEEVESIKRWMKNIQEGKIKNYEQVKSNARERILSKQKIYA